MANSIDEEAAMRQIADLREYHEMIGPDYAGGPGTDYRDLARRLAEAIRDFRLNTTEQTSYRLDLVLAEARAAGVIE